MGQQEVLDFFKGKSEWFSAQDIEKKTKMSIGSIRAALKKLFEQGYVFRALQNRRTGYIVYVYRGRDQALNF